MDDTIIAEFDGQRVEIPAHKINDKEYIKTIRAKLLNINQPQTEQGIISKGWEALKKPEEMSRSGLQQITDLVTPSRADIEAGKVGIPGIAARTAGETLSEVAPSFVSRGAMVTGGALKGAQMAAPVISAAGRGIAKGMEGISGLEFRAPGALKKVFNEPSIMWGKGKKAVGEMFASRADPKALEEGILDIKNMADKKDIVTTSMEAAKNGLLSPDEAILARRELWSLKKQFPKPYFQNAYDTLGKIAKTKYGDLDPKFERAAISEAVRTIFPTNKLGGTSTAKIALGSLASGGNLLMGNPVGAAASSLMSPIVQGSLAAGAGGLAKIAKPVVNYPILPTATKAGSRIVNAAKNLFKTPSGISYKVIQ